MEFISALVKSHPGKAVVVLIVATLFVAKHLKRGIRGGKPKLRLRSSSLGSTQFMASRIIEKADPARDSIINLALRYKSNQGPTMHSFRSLFKHKIIPHVRFHSVPVQEVSGGAVTWVPKKIDLDSHFISHRPIDESAGETFEKVIDEIINLPLTDRENKPWWEVRFLENTNEKDKKVVVIMRVHHALGDGVSLMEMFADTMTDENGVPIPGREIFHPVRDDDDGAKRRRSSIVDVAKKWLKVPYQAYDLTCNVIGTLDLALGSHDTPNKFFDYRERLKSLSPSMRFMVLYFPAIELEILKRIKLAVEQRTKKHITINDVLFAVFAGAIRRYLLHFGSDVSKVSMRALTPFAFPEPVCEQTRYLTLLRNHWTFIWNYLPLQESSPVDRIVKSHELWNYSKHSTKLAGALLVHKIGSLQSVSGQRDGYLKMCMRSSLVFSNVPGPARPVHFAGGAMYGVHMIFPNAVPQTGIVTLSGFVHFCLTVEETNENKIHMRELLPKFYMEELREAAKELGMPPPAASS